MRKFKMVVQYVGTSYGGWQIQPNSTAIQEILQSCLSQILQEKIIVIGSGRTDAGVHATGQVAHFRTSHPIEIQNLHKGVNALLPGSISVLTMEEVALDFHAMQQAKTKTYSYLVLNAEHPTPFLNPFTWRRRGYLDIEEMQLCLQMLVGVHDFSSFRASGSDAKTSVREILVASLRVLPLQDLANSLKSLLGLDECLTDYGAEDSFHPGESEARILAFNFKGRGFLKHMIRNIVGTIVEVGTGRLTSERFAEIFEAKDRRKAGITAPGRGLFMVKVDY